MEAVFGMDLVSSVLRIQGGSPLVGEVSVGGSKNACLAVLASVPLVDGVITLTNLPDISDVAIKLELLQGFGIRVERDGDRVTLDTTGLRYFEPDELHVRRIRTSFYLLGPLLARFGKARLPMPGGCSIGDRPVDFHMKGLARLGATVDLDSGHYTATGERLQGAEIHFDFPSAGATQHMMATACLVPGVTTIDNAAVEPEVLQLADFLTACGARLEGVGTSRITVYGVERLHGADYRIPEDRIQVGTYLLAGAITGGSVTCRDILPDYQTALLTKLQEMGADVEEGNDYVTVGASRRLRSVKVRTMPYPGFATDMQQPFAALLTLADGASQIEETIYENRFGHVRELTRMGADVTNSGRTATFVGVERLSGAMVEASDLRAGACLVLAGLAAQGTTHVHNVHFIDRGYENLEANLRALGASVERVSGEAPVG